MLQPNVTGKRMPGDGPGRLKKPRRRGRSARKKVQRARGPPEPPLTMSIPEAGRKYFGLSRNGSYAAADRGDIPTIRVGPKLRRVPVRAMERKLDEAGERKEAAA
jgi:hypothetical protein